MHVATLVRAIANEHACCPFIGLDLSLPPNGSRARLTLHGPAPTKDIIATMMHRGTAARTSRR